MDDPVEHAFMTATLQAAEKLRVERQENFFKQMQIVIQNAIAGALGKK